MRTKTWAAAAVVLSALAVGACGSSGSSSSTSSDVAAFCAKVNELNGVANPFQNVQHGDVNGAKVAFAKLKSEFEGFAAVAPDAIRPEVESIGKVYDQMTVAVKGANTPAAFAQAVQSFQSQAASIQKDSQAVQAYEKKNCLHS